MKTDISTALVNEHVLIKRMLALIERFAPLTAAGQFSDWQFYLDGVDFIRNYADRFHHAKEEDVLFEALVANGMPRQNSPVAAMLMEHDQGRAYVRALEAGASKALAGETARNSLLPRTPLPTRRCCASISPGRMRSSIPWRSGFFRKPCDLLFSAYRRAEDAAGADFTARYTRIVEGYEQRV